MAGMAVVAGISEPVTRLLLGPDNTILASGGMGLTRYLPTGTLDPTFGIDGVLGGERLPGVRPDGRLVDVTYAYGPDGTLDVRFTQQLADGSWSRPVLADGRGWDSPTQALVLANGKTVVASSAGSANSSGVYSSHLALFQYNPDGTLDTTFGTAGVAITEFPVNRQGGATGMPTKVIQQADGKLLVGGTSSVGEMSATVVRYTADGRLDPTFGNGGISSAKGSPTYSPGLVDMVLQPDGSIVAIGAVQEGYNELDLALYKFNANGSLDPSFGQGGVQWVSLSEHSDKPLAFERQSDGKFLALVAIDDSMGTTANPAAGPQALVVLRFTATGALDTSFGAQGRVELPSFKPTTFSWGVGGYQGDLLVLADDSFVVGGVVADNTRALIRFDRSGNPDASFGVDQGVRTSDQDAGTSNSGTQRADILRAYPGSTVEGLQGDDWIRGWDSVVEAVKFADVRANFKIDVGNMPPLMTYRPPSASDLVTVKHLAGDLGTDTLVYVDRLLFADGGIAFDLAGAAGRVVKTIGAVFGVNAVQDHPGYVGIGLHYADTLSFSYGALVQLALDARLGAGASHESVINLLYSNVFGVTPDAGTLETYASMLRSGEYSHSSLGVLAAENVGVDLVGLAATGVAFA